MLVKKKWTINDLGKSFKIKKRKNCAHQHLRKDYIYQKLFTKPLSDFLLRQREPCFTMYPQQFFELHLHG